MNDIDKVRELGKSIGYGHLMQIASALWREMLKQDDIESGAFVPVCISSIKKRDIKMINDSIESYNKIINNEIYDKILNKFVNIPEFSYPIWVKLNGEDFELIKSLSKSVDPIKHGTFGSSEFMISSINENKYRLISNHGIIFSIEIKI